MLKIVLSLLLYITSAFAMHSASLNINNVDLELDARLDVGQFNHSIDPDSVLVGFKVLHGSDENSEHDAHDSDSDLLDDYYELNFLMQRKIDSSNFIVGLGVKVNATENFTSVPLGIEIAYKMPFSISIPIYAKGMLYYAPEVLSNSDAKNFLEYRMEVEFKVIRNAAIMIGLRNLDTNYVHADFSYNQSAYAGFKFSF